MKPKNNTVKILGAALLFATVATAPAFVSADLVIDRGLPTENLNNAAGSARSNVAWGSYLDTDGVSWFTGDTFSLPVLCRQWTIDAIRIWSPAAPVGSSELDDFYDSITLYGGTYQSHPARTVPLAELSTGKIDGNSSENPDIKFTRVTYADGTDYQGTTQWRELWQVDFTNLNWVVDSLALLESGGVLEFGVNATGSTPWYNHASNRLLSGSKQQDSNDMFSQISEDGFTVYDCDSGSADPFCPWNKSSDINVQVFATPVPGALPLAVIGLFGLTAIRRTRAKAGAAMQPAC